MALASPLWIYSLHSRDGTLHNWIRRIIPPGENTRASGKASSYGRKHGLSQHFCRLNFNGGNVPDLQNEFIQDQGGKLQIANHVSGVPCHYAPGRGQLPAMRKAAAQALSTIYLRRQKADNSYNENQREKYEHNSKRQSGKFNA